MSYKMNICRIKDPRKCCIIYNWICNRHIHRNIAKVEIFAKSSESRTLCALRRFPSRTIQTHREIKNECARQRSDVQNTRFTWKFVTCQWSKHLQKVNLSLIRLKKTYGFPFRSFCSVLFSFCFFSFFFHFALLLFRFCSCHRCQSHWVE